MDSGGWIQTVGYAPFIPGPEPDMSVLRNKRTKSPQRQSFTRINPSHLIQTLISGFLYEIIECLVRTE